jgi:hypothetical protein
LREGDRWYFWRSAINHLILVRTKNGWRVKEHFNRELDGSQDSHDTMRKMLAWNDHLVAGLPAGKGRGRHHS